MRPSGYIKIKDTNNNLPSKPVAGSIVANALISQAIDGASKDWKDIKPVKNYMDIKKKAYVE